MAAVAAVAAVAAGWAGGHDQERKRKQGLHIQHVHAVVFTPPQLRYMRKYTTLHCLSAGDSRATPEEKLRAKAQRAAEAAERRAELLTNPTAHQPHNCS